MKEPHIHTPAHDAPRVRPALFPLMTQPAPDTAEQKRLQIQAIPFWRPKPKEEPPHA